VAYSCFHLCFLGFFLITYFYFLWCLFVENGLHEELIAPVLEDRETQAKNWVRNEEEKRQKDEKKAKKAKVADDLAKHCHEAMKVGLSEPKSPKASISEGEGLDDSYYLNELLEELESPVGGVRRL